MENNSNINNNNRGGEEISIIQQKQNKVMKRNSNGGYPIGQGFFRAVSAMATFAAALLMALNQETHTIDGFPMHASYHSSPAFRFFLYGNGIACGYSLVSLPLVSVFGTSYLMHLFDMLAMGLVMGCATGAAAIGYVGKHGNNHIGWIQVCSYYEKFCKQMTFSVGCSYLGCLLLLAVSALSSANKLI
ncbi:Casparian strip membrane protein [Dioscorea alata]|uniref:Casparian strip membrane protein n=1 Tax=Dioscorea alata TaxID=55571 RepID=A0ACB7UC40_DIOAL|nr:Casparian strip membrane protein [Dioscorea alata]